MKPLIAELQQTAIASIEAGTSEAQGLIEISEAYEISDIDMLQAGANQLKEIKATEKQLEEMRVNLKKPFLDGGKEIDSFFKAPIEFCQKAERILKNKCLAFQQEQERQRREAEAEARRLAEIERQKIEAEQRAKAEALRKQAEQASAAEAEALREQAAEVESTPVVVPVSTEIAEQTKVTGINSRVTHKARVTDLKAFLQAALNDDELLAMVSVDQSALNARARSAKTAMKVAGVEVYEDRTLAVR